jgi:hypothetical protein
VPDFRLVPGVEWALGDVRRALVDEDDRLRDDRPDILPESTSSLLISLVATETQTPCSFLNIWQCSSKVAVSISWSWRQCTLLWARLSRIFAACRGLGGRILSGCLELDVARDSCQGDTLELRDLPPWDAAFYGVEHLEPEVLRVSVHPYSVAVLQSFCEPL